MQQNHVLDLPVSPHAAGECPVDIQPVVIDGCFGWLHTPPSRLSAETAVLLCPALRDDGLTAHSQFRRLAQYFALAGYPTLRFDYPGTGDSCDVDPATDLWAAWCKSVHAAADWLRTAAGARRLVLCGLRLGAILAADAARQRDDIAALVLLAPVARGRSFIRQLEVEAKLAGKPPADALLLDGVPLAAASVQAIAGAELVRMMPPEGCATAIFSHTPSAVLDQCSDEWTRKGVAVDQAAFAGMEPLLRSRVVAHEPPAEFTGVTDWVCHAAPACPAGSVRTPPALPLTQADWRETPLRFGPDRRLFGMLCQPRDQDGDQVVLILNSGGDPHYGAERSGTMMARQFAAAGIASLRMDFAGLGDSMAPDDGQTHVFETDRRAEASAGLDALAALGYTRLALCGLCSGAYHGFHAAAADERVETLMLVNLPTLEWQVGTDIESFRLYTVDIRRARARHVWLLGTWRRLLKGELHIWEQVADHGGKAVKRLRAVFDRARPACRPASAAQAAMAAISRRTRTLILMSPVEVGLVALDEEFGPGCKLPNVTLHVLPSIDHTVTDPAMRVQVTTMMIGFLAAGPKRFA